MQYVIMIDVLGESTEYHLFATAEEAVEFSIAVAHSGLYPESAVLKMTETSKKSL